MGKRSRNDMRLKRHRRVRVKIAGRQDRPRLNVYRSLNQIYAQLIDDGAGQTVISVSTLDPEIRAKRGELSKVEQAKLVGEALAEKAKQAGIQQVVFDRGGYKYHGRVRALAEAARGAGLEF